MAKSQSTLELEAALPSIASEIPDLKKSGSESSGPCPSCAGTDRFVVRSNGTWFCRQCRPTGPNQLIDFHKWRYGLTFKQLCAKHDVPTNGNRGASAARPQEQPLISPRQEPAQKPTPKKPAKTKKTAHIDFKERWKAGPRHRP